MLSLFAAAAVEMLVSSCASITVNSLPQPGGNHRDGYDIVIEFANVLNLPERAKVVQDGTTIGVVTHVDLKSTRVDVTSRIDPGVVVPANARATLQQSTVLAYLDAIKVLAITALLMLPLVALAKPGKVGGAPAGCASA